ncbi:hypothetical protein DVH24_024900 [Malus domestica]|uniref:Uncharacterized protein n=1 Tax=Malus domestica TaxID=3750 RepID=A0A498JJH3_MALDO|nr:hypothetical protein DVH24_024900 [Malus domestica]
MLRVVPHWCGTIFSICLYDLELLSILSIGFMVEPQFHHGIRAGCSRVTSNGHTRSTLENPPHMRGRVESCTTLMRDKNLNKDGLGSQAYALSMDTSNYYAF